MFWEIICLFGAGKSCWTRNMAGGTWLDVATEMKHNTERHIVSCGETVAIHINDQGDFDIGTWVAVELCSRRQQHVRMAFWCDRQEHASSMLSCLHAEAVNSALSG
jgi:hypothetical protein